MPRTLDASDFRFSPGHYVRSLYSPGRDPIIPADLFITSGEAVQKTRELRKQIAALRPYVLTLPPNAHINQFGATIQAAIDETDRLLTFLLTNRGAYIFLECYHEGGHVVCRGTNPKTVERKTKYRPRTNPFLERDIAKIKDYAKKGVSIPTIANTYRVSRDTIAQILN